MKKIFIAAVLLAAGAFSAHSQTKGTNSLGFGFGTYNSSSEWASDIGTSESKGKGMGVNVNYGRFIKDNTKLSVFLGYSHTKNESEFQSTQSISKSNSWSGGLGYDKYYPLFKKFYATVGGGLGYNYSKSELTKTNYYSISGNGGVSYFVNKHLAIGTTLLSASASYSKQTGTQSASNGIGKTETSSFGLSTGGNFTNLGFNIYFLF